jgi:diguanylate cyclase (GGDEF)-like protein
LFLNLDHFKLINVGYGFSIGDNLLNMLREKILRSMRSSDHIFYMGKDEFLFLLPNTSVTGGRIVGERLRALIKSVYLTIGMQRIGCTASVGGITIQNPTEQIFEVMWPQVHEQLRQAKSKGRNKVVWRLSKK